LRVSTVGVELNKENSAMAREGKVHGERQGSDKRSENAFMPGINHVKRYPMQF
jgi:hypothetical protein